MSEEVMKKIEEFNNSKEIISIGTLSEDEVILLDYYMEKIREEAEQNNLFGCKCGKCGRRRSDTIAVGFEFFCTECFEKLDRCSSCDRPMEVEFPKNYPKDYKLCCYCLDGLEEAVLRDCHFQSPDTEALLNKYTRIY